MTAPVADMIVIAVVAFCAGFIRGFAGFGGPAFMLATLTLFYAPASIVGKILVVDLTASGYLFYSIFRQIRWRETLALAIPTWLTLPVGQWLLLTLDASDMQRAIAAVIMLTCLLLLAGFRYRKPMGLPLMILTGLVSGVIFGATYIALTVVAVILLGPYDKHDARTLIISWAFLVAAVFAGLSLWSGMFDIHDLTIALPAVVTYFVGTWLGSRGFSAAKESTYRRYSLILLLILAILGFVNK